VAFASDHRDILELGLVHHEQPRSWLYTECEK